jgi:hypothetical protein
MIPNATPENPEKHEDVGISAALRAAVCSENYALALLIDAWPQLSRHIRQQIIMLSLTKSDTQVTQRAEDKLEE